tara:strand:+ start:536 stop:859 length:324 start_codon:yes stop_codon:yes gene_type:complete
MVDRYVDDNGVRRLATADELAEINARETAWNNEAPNRKLNLIKEERDKKLQETDFYALSDVTMSDAMSTYRQTLRDIPQDYTTESQYDLLLARDIDGNLTHTVWEKP